MYTGNYFTEKEVEGMVCEYEKIVEESGRHGVDLLVCNQWPVNILKYTGDEFPDLYFNFSSKLAML